nr:MAG TPA: hypothetical protein [Caudoviricetes sp.]
MCRPFCFPTVFQTFHYYEDCGFPIVPIHSVKNNWQVRKTFL